jgi:hypothetical protein
MAKDFDQYMAESGRQGELDQLRRDFKYDEAKSRYEQGGFGSSGSSSQSSYAPATNFQDIVKESLRLQQEAAKPAISSLQSSIPEVQQKFATEKQQVQAQVDPLKQRYQNLLSEVKGQAQSSINQQTKITSGELGKRGIVGSSTLAQQEIQNAVQPIQSNLTSATKDIGLSQEESLMGIQNLISSLTGQETEQTRAIQNAIAGLQSGDFSSASSSALSQLQLQQQQAAQQQAAQQAAEEKALAERLYSTIQLPESQASIQNTQSLIADRNKASSGLSLTDFLTQFGIGSAKAATPTQQALQSVKPTNQSSLRSQVGF